MFHPIHSTYVVHIFRTQFSNFRTPNTKHLSLQFLIFFRKVEPENHNDEKFCSWDFTCIKTWRWQTITTTQNSSYLISKNIRKPRRSWLLKETNMKYVYFWILKNYCPRLNKTDKMRIKSRENDYET